MLLSPSWPPLHHSQRTSGGQDTGFVEYDHYNFDRGSDNFVCGPVACFGRTFGFPVEVKETKDVFKVGVNFLWSPGAGGFGARY
ncbi:MAG: hypothetical protein QOH31_6025 [Verrucomicrobiota bacterium]|jgi:hypothetical protein